MTEPTLPAEYVSPAQAIVWAIEASLALKGQPDWSTNMAWSISMERFWMRLADEGYEVTRRTDADA